MSTSIRVSYERPEELAVVLDKLQPLVERRMKQK